MKKLSIWIFLLGVTSSLLGQVDRPSKPNVILMLVDDLGWQDVVCYDLDEPCPYETPNIDRLAKKGVLFKIYL